MYCHQKKLNNGLNKILLHAEEYIKTEEAKEDGNPYQGYMSIANDYRWTWAISRQPKMLIIE